jgi:hypothetical protein
VQLSGASLQDQPFVLGKRNARDKPQTLRKKDAQQERRKNLRQPDSFTKESRHQGTGRIQQSRTYCFITSDAGGVSKDIAAREFSRRISLQGYQE